MKAHDLHGFLSSRQLRGQGLQVFVGDGASADLRKRLDVSRIELILIATPATEECRNISEQLKPVGYRGKIATIARFEDHRDTLLSYGIDQVFNFFAEAGAALPRTVCD